MTISYTNTVNNSFGGFVQGYSGSMSTVAKNILCYINGIRIGEIDDDGVPIPSMTTAEVDVTNQDSGIYKEWKPGRRDGNECRLRGHFAPSDLGQQALINAANLQTIDTYVIVFPNGSSWTYQGLMRTFGTNINKQIIQFEATVKVTGAPVLATIPAQLTAFTLNPSATPVTPALPTSAAVPGTWMADFAHATASVQVTPTWASATAVVTINGVACATTGTQSAAIALTSGAITTITIMITDTGLAAGIYTILAARAAT